MTLESAPLEPFHDFESHKIRHARFAATGHADPMRHGRPVNTPSTMAARMKAIRLRFEYTQGGMAQAIGSKLRSWQEWEAGNRLPGSSPLAGLTRLGVNVNWLLVGDGPELVVDRGTRPQPEPGFDRALLEDILEVLHDYRDHKIIRLRPAQEAELVATVYDYMIKPRHPNNGDRQRTLELVRTLIDEKHIAP